MSSWTHPHPHHTPADAAACAAFSPVHLSLAVQNAVGWLPVLDGAPDEPSAVFHLAHAARGGSQIALRALRDLCRGVTQDVLPGLRLAGELPAETVRAMTAALARGGDAAAAEEVGDEAAAAGKAEEAITWLCAALGGLKAAEEGEEAEVGAHRAGLLERIGRARAATGDGAGAAKAYGEASEAAAAAGKGKLAARLAELAESAEE